MLDTLPDAPEQSILSYNSFATALYNPATGTAFGTQPQTGDNGANFFLGVADAYSQQRRPQNFNMNGKNLGGVFPGQLEGAPRPHPEPRRALAVPRPVRRPYGMTAAWDFPGKSLVRNVHHRNS